MQIIPLYFTESEEKLKSLLKEVKEESEKAGLKVNIQKMKIFKKWRSSKNEDHGFWSRSDHGK